MFESDLLERGHGRTGAAGARHRTAQCRAATWHGFCLASSVPYRNAPLARALHKQQACQHAQHYKVVMLHVVLAMLHVRPHNTHMPAMRLACNATNYIGVTWLRQATRQQRQHRQRHRQRPQRPQRPQRYWVRPPRCTGLANPTMCGRTPKTTMRRYGRPLPVQYRATAAPLPTAHCGHCATSTTMAHLPTTQRSAGGW